jgi:hypothetical protein
MVWWKWIVLSLAVLSGTAFVILIVALFRAVRDVAQKVND